MAQMAKVGRSIEDRERTDIASNGLYSIHSPDAAPDRQMRYSEKGTFPWCIGEAKIWGIKRACVVGIGCATDVGFGGGSSDTL